jgi:hypothetical protein
VNWIKFVEGRVHWRHIYDNDVAISGSVTTKYLLNCNCPLLCSTTESGGGEGWMNSTVSQTELHP